MADSTPVLRPMALARLPKRPLVSILIANYNYARFLPAALDSLQAQSYDHWEAVVCDDGSTDGSADVVRRYAEQDARIGLIEKSNGGQNTAVNECYRHLTGDIICLLDSDDSFDSHKLERVVAAMLASPHAGVVNHFCHVIDGDGKTLPITLNHRLDDGWLGDSAFERGGCVYVPTTSCMSFRREVLELLMPMPARQKRDADGYLGMAAQFLTPFILIDAPLSGYRVHGNNMGGLTDPTPQRLQYELDLITERTDTLKDFVAERFSEFYSKRLHVEDNPQYLQAALKLHAIGDRKSRAGMADADSLMKRHPNAQWRAVWKTIMSIPGPVRRRMLPLMHRSHKLKGAIRRLIPRPAGVA
ncbi:MAG: glycosyl transferase family 2 [Phycisphaerales bacterium]|nr:glycosyl transferase family 2 [Phycisphaerales bacterium]